MAMNKNAVIIVLAIIFLSAPVLAVEFQPTWESLTRPIAQPGKLNNAVRYIIPDTPLRSFCVAAAPLTIC